MEKQVEIKEFLGVFDGFVTDEYCDEMIRYMHDMREAGRAFSRQDLKDNTTLQKNDYTVFMHQQMDFPRTGAILQPFMKAFWEECYEQYIEHFPILKTAPTASIFSCRLQQTPIGGGYHIWHAEATDKINTSRIIAWMLCLNDVTEGGETEFLYQHRRVTPKKGRIIIWPAGFTHVHRGNTPLSNEKYILTGWLEMIA